MVIVSVRLVIVLLVVCRCFDFSLGVAVFVFVWWLGSACGFRLVGGCLWMICVGLLLDCGFDVNGGLFGVLGDCVVQGRLVGWVVAGVDLIDYLLLLVLVNCGLVCLVVVLYLVLWFCLFR